MIEAFLHGKLAREQENMEDMLTSCVFGSFRLVPPNEGLIPFLALSEAFGGDAGFLPETVSPSIAAEDVEYEFWPMLQAEGCHRCEPDLLVTIKPIKQLVLVEAKLFSGKSTEPDDGPLPYDQLAREWDNVLVEAEFRGLQPNIVYLTADIQMPKEDIRSSIAEFRKKRSERVPPRIYWLSWQHLLQVKTDNRGGLQRLRHLLGRLDLLPFAGLPPVHSVPHYEFARVPLTFHWESCTAPITSDWEFAISNE